MIIYNYDLTSFIFPFINHQSFTCIYTRTELREKVYVIDKKMPFFIESARAGITTSLLLYAFLRLNLKILSFWVIIENKSNQLERRVQNGTIDHSNESVIKSGNPSRHMKVTSTTNHRNISGPDHQWISPSKVYAH